MQIVNGNPTFYAVRCQRNICFDSLNESGNDSEMSPVRACILKADVLK